MATSARSVVLHQVTAFRKVWDDVGTGFRPYDATFFAPLPPAPNTFIVGDVIERGQKQSPSTTTAWAVSDSSNNPSLQPLLAAPIGFTRVWDTTHTSAKSPCSIWLPIPPSVRARECALTQYSHMNDQYRLRESMNNRDMRHWDVWCIHRSMICNHAIDPRWCACCARPLDLP